MFFKNIASQNDFWESVMRFKSEKTMQNTLNLYEYNVKIMLKFNNL